MQSRKAKRKGAKRMAYNVAPPNGWPQLNINDVDVDTSALANKVDIATEFSDLTNYSAGDLVYYDGALYEFQVDHTAGAWETSEVIQKDLSDVINSLRNDNPLQIKTKTYVGTGEATNVIDFGTDTPKMFCINVDPAYDNENKEWQRLLPIVYGDKLGVNAWSAGSNNVPTRNGNTQECVLEYTGNVVTITSNNAGSAINVDTVHYLVTYLV